MWGYWKKGTNILKLVAGWVGIVMHCVYSSTIYARESSYYYYYFLFAVHSSSNQSVVKAPAIKNCLSTRKEKHAWSIFFA